MKSNEDDNISLIIVSLILILIFWSWLSISFASSAKSNVIVPCPRGQCATNVQTGSKRCPIDFNETIYLDPSQEVCNPPNACTNPATPYPVFNDFSTGLGICPNNICPCTATKSCPSYSMVLFDFMTTPVTQTVGGNVALGGTILKPSSTQTCTIGSEDLVFLNCTGYIEQCVNTNPCMSGILSFIPDPLETPEEFMQRDNKTRFPLSCIPGNACPVGYPIYDFSTGISKCLQP